MEKENTTKKNNVLAKLNKARLKIQELTIGDNAVIKKTGNNAFAGFNYFELKDFLPYVNTVFDKLGLCAVFKYNPNEQVAELHITSIDTLDVITFNCPWVQFVPPANAKMNNVQAMGSTITYIHRYLYMIALNIVENDTFDATLGAELAAINERLKNLTSNPEAPDSEKKKLFNEAKSLGYSWDPCKKKFV